MSKYGFRAIFLELESVLGSPDEDYALTEAKKIVHKLVKETQTKSDAEHGIKESTDNE